jgi:hypothetical protein
MFSLDIFMWCDTDGRYCDVVQLKSTAKLYLLVIVIDLVDLPHLVELLECELLLYYSQVFVNE